MLSFTGGRTDEIEGVIVAKTTNYLAIGKILLQSNYCLEPQYKPNLT